MNLEYIETSRLRLRKITASHYTYVFENFNETEVKMFFGSSSHQDYLMEKRRNEGGLETFNRSFVVWHIIEKNSGTVIGWCGYHTWYLDHDRAELGYGLFEEKHKRKGIMSETLRAVLAYGFEEMNLTRIEAFTATDNIASIGVVEKFGFQYEGRLRQHYKVNGHAHDSNVYSLLRSEYLPICGGDQNIP